MSVTRRLLEKLPPNEISKKTYVYDRHLFHFIVDDGMVYLCMTDEEFGRRVPFAFLEDIKNRFIATYGNRGKTAPLYGMNEDFARILQNQMNYFSNTQNVDKISKAKQDIDELKSVMVENIEKVLQRGDRIELLVDKTEQLEGQAIQFKKQSTALKRSMYWKNVKMCLLLVLVCVIIAYFIAAVICGLLFQDCRSSSSPPPPPQGSFSISITPSSSVAPKPTFSAAVMERVDFSTLRQRLRRRFTVAT